MITAPRPARTCATRSGFSRRADPPCSCSRPAESGTFDEYWWPRGEARPRERPANWTRPRLRHVQAQTIGDRATVSALRARPTAPYGDQAVPALTESDRTRPAVGPGRKCCPQPARQPGAGQDACRPGTRCARRSCARRPTLSPRSGSAGCLQPKRNARGIAGITGIGHATKVPLGTVPQRPARQGRRQIPPVPRPPRPRRDRRRRGRGSTLWDEVQLLEAPAWPLRPGLPGSGHDSRLNLRGAAAETARRDRPGAVAEAACSSRAGRRRELRGRTASGVTPTGRHSCVSGAATGRTTIPRWWQRK